MNPFRISLFIVLTLLLSAVASARTNLIVGDTGKDSWHLTENVAWDGDKIVITEELNDLIGAAWFEKQIDLNEDFYFVFNVNLGIFDDDGADGMVFVLAPGYEITEVGQGLGYQGLDPSFGVEIDTYPNDGEHMGDDLGDPLNDHLAIDAGGSADHHTSSLPLIEVENLEDGNDHTFAVKWTAAEKLFQVYLDDLDKPLIDLNDDIVAKYLEGNNLVNFGFTGSTGFFINRQYFTPLKLFVGPEEEVPVVEQHLGWTCAGSAKWDGKKIVLTPEDYGILGSAWYDKEIDLAKNFDMEFLINLGANDEEGADGIVFVLASELEGYEPGQGLGYQGITPSFALEIDTHPNDGEHVGDDLGDPLEDHLAFDHDGVANHLELGNETVEVGNLEDGADHMLRIVWNAKDKIMQAYLDDPKIPVLEYQGDIVAEYLNGKNIVKMGFTGSTGVFANEQYFIPVNIVN